MNTLINQIITLENQEKYLILTAITLDNQDYYYANLLSPDGTEITETFSIMTIEEKNETYKMEQVTDPFLLEQLSPLIQGRL